ncbi:hypothetical protein TcasGA2_TC002827 [Tribolium castaneum]|uniref:Uncharacterized protein n=1 Tax=Tribolium castaneum TaxID=7070 RepID=D6WI88_TRICA|nr:hypothetical protein TcasGA2_TC002827 [Tribolium castaneum]
MACKSGSHTLYLHRLRYSWLFTPAITNPTTPCIIITGTFLRIRRRSAPYVKIGRRKRLLVIANVMFGGGNAVPKGAFSQIWLEFCCDTVNSQTWQKFYRQSLTRIRNVNSIQQLLNKYVGKQ